MVQVIVGLKDNKVDDIVIVEDFGIAIYIYDGMRLKYGEDNVFSENKEII